MNIYYTIYCTTNLINNKIYIGKHKTTDPYDDYLGSGLHITASIKKYGKENFSKEVLFIFDNAEEMELKEIELVNETFIKRSDTYNKAQGGQGGKMHDWNIESRQKLSMSLSNRINTWGNKISAANLGKPLKQSTKDAMSKKRSNRGEADRINKYSSCQHCGAIMNLGNLARYHNDNCKTIRSVNEL